MSKMASAAYSKEAHKRNPKLERFKQLVPRPGSRLRKFYNLLMLSKGDIINVSHLYPRGLVPASAVLSAAEQLRNFYGLDVRPVREPKNGTGRVCFILVGEWKGRTYIDYMVRHGDPVIEAIIKEMGDS